MRLENYDPNVFKELKGVAYKNLLTAAYVVKDKTVQKSCACGCGETITIKSHHKWRGIPDYVRGHSSRVNNPMTGKHSSEETRKKLSAAHLGKQPRLGYKSSEATKQKISDASKRAWQNPEYRKFHEEMNIGRKASEQRKKLISIANTGKIRSSETCRKIGEAHKGKVLSEEHRKKLSIAGKGRVFTKNHRDKIAADKKIKFTDPAFSKKMGIAWGLKPNKPEALVLQLLNEMYPGEWKYTGDFSFTVNGKSPDFTNCNGQKKLIEIFGDYWHFGENPQDRIDTFKPFGFNTLVIWEKELKNINDVASRIQEFHEDKQCE